MIEGQPFFHVQNFHNTHEGQLHFNKEHLESALKTNDLDSIKPFPYHPDTPTFRYTQSLLHNHHKDVDKEIGKLIDDLENEGLLDNTIIFYYGDHGESYLEVKATYTKVAKCSLSCSSARKI